MVDSSEEQKESFFCRAPRTVPARSARIVAAAAAALPWGATSSSSWLISAMFARLLSTRVARRCATRLSQSRSMGGGGYVVVAVENELLTANKQHNAS